MKRLPINFYFKGQSFITMAIIGVSKPDHTDSEINQPAIVFRAQPVLSKSADASLALLNRVMPTAKDGALITRLTWVGSVNCPAVLDIATWEAYADAITEEFSVDLYLWPAPFIADSQVIIVRKDIGFFYAYFRFLVDWFWLLQHLHVFAIRYFARTINCIDGVVRFIFGHD